MSSISWLTSWGRWLYLALAIALVSGCQTRSGLQVRDAWARPGVAGSNSAAYFTIENYGSEDSLLAIESPASDQIQLHRSSFDDQGVVHMVEQDQVALPAASTVTFEPGGLHAMFISINRQLEPGDSIELKFIFEKQEAVTIEAEVRGP